MNQERYFPLKGFSLDTADAYLTPDLARYLKNVVYADTSQTGSAGGSKLGLFKTMESVKVYDENFSLPEGYNHFAGGFNAEQTGQCLFFNYNENENHALYLIDANSRTIRAVYLKNCLNLQLAPEYFVHEGAAWIEVFAFTDPNTELPRTRTYFMWVDGFNDFRFICIEDSIATNSFDATQFPYFVGTYDPCLLINAGVPTPLDCIDVNEVANDDPSKPNALKFHTWQFRITEIDVYGRPSEHGIISTSYIPGINNCVASSDLLPRCLDLVFEIKSPLTDRVQIEYRNCNELQWYEDTTLFLYNGSNLGDWWLRGRNTSVQFNPTTFEVTYRFCNDKSRNPIDQDETNRTQNPMPRVSQSAAKVGKVMGLGNNKEGFNPLLPSVLDQITFDVIPPTTGNTDTRNIEIYVPIINPFTQTYQPVYRNDDGVFVWGGRYANTNQYVSEVKSDYKQYFGDPNQKGFIGYLAATGEPPNAAVSEMYYADNTTNEFIKVDDFTIVNNFPYIRRYYQKFTFNSVPKAKYIFRIADSVSLLTDKDFQNTSTYVFGSFPWAGKTTNFNNLSSSNFGAVSISKELEIDVCDADYNSLNDLKVLAIFDLTHPGSTNNDAPKVGRGYAYERINPDDGQPQFPVELLRITAYDGGDQTYVNSRFTDHNGFYFTADHDKEYRIDIYGDCGCQNYTRLATFLVGNDGGVYENNAIMQGSTNCADFYDKLCSGVKITGFVKLCDSELPIPGVGVVLSRGGYAITGADGSFTILAHSDNTVSGATRVDKLFYVPTICPFTDCNEDCLDTPQIIITACVTCTERIITVDLQQVLFKTKRGLLSGGNYGFGITCHDWLRRHGFVQTKDSFYKTMPTLIQTQNYSPSQVRLTIPPSVTFPPWVRKITPCVTKELSLEDYLTWIVDRVVFIDNSGDENNISPTQIKIYYGSLNEYNTQNNFNTTTDWQFIVQSEPQQINFTSDYVEFYVNGDGQFFPQLVRAIIKYDKEGQYFLVDYDTALKDLKQYALIRLSRPSLGESKDVFYELCQSIDVINGKAQTNQLILDAFDTYYLFRQISIPIPTDDVAVSTNVLRTFGFPFEHHSPSDLWGDHCGNYGRINSRNPYEAEIIKENEIALSGAISVNGQANYLNYFDQKQKRNFDTWDYYGIVSIIPYVGGVLVICQQRVFMVGFNDNIMRVVNGQVQIPSAEDKFGNPQSDTTGEYGCLLFDKNTIRKREGLVQFLDSSKAYLIQHDFNDAKPVSMNVIDSWLRPKVKYVNEWNLTHENKKYFTATIDPGANGYTITDFTIRSTEFTNTERDKDITKHETMSFDIYTKAFRTWWIYTPAGYLMMDSNLLEKQVFSFANNTVYYHYSTSPSKTFGNVYGVPAEKVVRFICVMDNIKKKQGLSVAVYCVQSKYFADEVKNDSGQLTRMLLEYWRQGNFFSAAPVLCDLNTPFDPNLPLQTGVNKLTDGNKMEGSILDIRLIGDPAKNEIYSEFLGATVGEMPIEKSGT